MEIIAPYYNNYNILPYNLNNIKRPKLRTSEAGNCLQFQSIYKNNKYVVKYWLLTSLSYDPSTDAEIRKNNSLLLKFQRKTKKLDEERQIVIVATKPPAQFAVELKSGWLRNGDTVSFMYLIDCEVKQVIFLYIVALILYLDQILRSG